MKIGKKLSPILEEIEMMLWEYEANNATPPEFPNEALRSSLKILMSVLLDKIWNLQENEKMNLDNRLKMAEHAGKELKKLVLEMTGIDTTELFNLKK
jgi:hypothetical protein